MTIALAAGSIEAIAEPPATSAIGKVDELPALLADLNADRYEARQRAHRRLAELAKSPEMRGRLAAEYQRLLLDPNTPSEVRTAIESLHASLPLKAPAEVSSEAGEAVDEAPVDFEALVRNLSDDRYNVRTASFARIQWLLGRTEWIAPIMTTLKSRLAAAEGNLQLRRQLESLYEAARGAWLLSEPGKVVLPAISDEQITQWIDDFLHTGNDTRAQHVRRLAEIELLEALARDDVLPRVRAKLETMRGRTDLTAEARSRLAEFMEWLLPAMVAEYWELDPTTNVTHHTGIQHLLLGVPNQPPLAERASLFDRCNERTAHCVTGNALSLGDYPVGVFFPHPTKGLAEFHLVNLPTPRRRMAYEFAVKRDAATRFVEITQRTLARYLEEKRNLEVSEIRMLDHLDVRRVSEFVGPYLMGCPESLHQEFCTMVAEHCTGVAVPGVMQAIAANRFQDKRVRPPSGLAWIACFAIAQRAPWDDVDTWLVDRIAGADVELGTGKFPTVRSMAAAVLLQRHGVVPSTMGLESVISDPLAMPPSWWPGLAYRFVDPSKADEVLRWWEKRSTKDSGVGSQRSSQGSGLWIRESGEKHVVLP